MNFWLRFIRNFLVFFLLIAFVITCCTMLFVRTLSETVGLELTNAHVELAAKITFFNVILLTVIFTVIDAVRRKLTVERPVRQIVQAAEKIIKGDFSVRIGKQKGAFSDDTFCEVIDGFNKMAQELGSVETLRTDFIASVSHEMKTPLAVIQNYGRLLQEKDLSEEERAEYAKGICDTSRRMADLVTNILKLNRLENQQIYPHASEFDLGEQLCDCLLQFENTWEQKNIEIETDIADGIRVSADAELLSLVWNNLFSNAFKFTESGGKVSLTLTHMQGYAVVKITDTGCGMSPEVGKHIFEKFYQGDTSHAKEGNGLGLALVKSVVDVLGGEISVESGVGVGTSFTVRLADVSH